MANDEMKKVFATNLRYWLKKRDKTQADLARYMKVSSATASDWCNGNKMPRTDKIWSICTWLGLEIDDLLKERDPNAEDASYYLNDDIRELAQFLFDKPEYKVLFDVARKVKKEDIQFVKDLMNRMIGK